MLRLPRFRSLGPNGLLRPDRCVVFSATTTGTKDGNQQNEQQSLFRLFVVCHIVTILTLLTQPEHGLNRAELLYQLLSMAGNYRDIPELLIDLLEI